MKLSSVITEMLVALEANIEYLRRHGSAQIKLRDGRLTEVAGNTLTYQFTLSSLQRIEPETDIEIRLADVAASGKVISCAEGSLHVTIEEYLGDKVANATLVISSYQLLEILRKRLEKIQSGEITLGKLASVVFDSRDFALRPEKSYTPPLHEKMSLNTYQLNAVRAALGSPVSFIWGPPGTGKTQTIASIIEGYLAQGKSVLLLSHTNLATDEALYKTLLHLGAENTYYQDGKIVRFGDTSLTELKDKFVSPDQIVARQGHALQEEMQNLNHEIDELSQEITTATTSLELFNEIEKLEHRAAELTRFIEKTTRTAAAYSDELQRKGQELTALQRIIDRHSASRPWQLLARRRLYLNQQRAAETKQLIAHRKTQLRELNKKILIAKSERAEIKSKKNSTKKQAPDKPYNYYQRIVQKKGNKLDQLHRKRHDIEQQLVKLKDKVLIEAQIIATTLTKSYMSKPILSRDYDCVILDEASMAPLPAILCASGLAKQHIVIVGDFLQLPPVVQYKTTSPDSREAQAVSDWLMRDIFTVAGIEQGIRKGKNPLKMLQLREQYRMHASIAEIVNRIAYGRFGEAYSLRTSKHRAANRRLHLSKPASGVDAPVAFYDTSARESRAVRSGNGSYYNLHNALVCIALATEARKKGYTSIGIVSAYRAQANLLQSMLADSPEDKTGIEADTVHRFQGGEKQLVILDITTPDPKSLYANTRDDTSLRLLNVAISRAQEKCLLVGDLQEIKRHHSPESPILQVVELLISKHYPVYDSRETLKEFQESEQTDIWLEKLSPALADNEKTGSVTLADETDFYGQFMRDMLTANHEVIIESPFITTRRINELFPYLEHLRRKGIEIYILTRAPSNHNDAMRQYAETEISRLSSLGIKVLAFPDKVHRKLAVIDRHILWEGSLNILSQNDSREAMWRSEGTHSAQQILQFLSLDHNLGPIGANNLRHCEYCTEPEAWYWTDKGKYGGSRTICLLRQHTPSTPPPTNDQHTDPLHESLVCPVHHRRLVRRTGRYGEFFGCPLYPTCTITRDVPDTVAA